MLHLTKVSAGDTGHLRRCSTAFDSEVLLLEFQHSSCPGSASGSSSALGSASEASVFECVERWVPEHKALRASNHWRCLVGGNACRFSSKPGRLDGKTDSWENLPNHAMTPGGHKALSSMRVRCSKWHGMAVQIVADICLAIRAPRLKVDAGFAHIAAKWAPPMIAGPRGPVLRDPALED